MFLPSKKCLNSPQICAVKERNPTEMRDLPSRYVEIGTQSAKIVIIWKSVGDTLMILS